MTDMFISAGYKNSRSEQIILEYAHNNSAFTLFQHMLEAIAQHDCGPKADAHIALCVKYALSHGCKESLVYNCYETDGEETGDYSDFYLFRDYTREVTDFLDEKLEWDLQLSGINDALIKRAVSLFEERCSSYNFKTLGNPSTLSN